MVMVVALDKPSDRTERILKFALEEAKLRNEKILFVHSLFGGDKTTEKEVKAGEELLEDAAKKAEAAGVKYETHLLVRGKNPGDDIVDFAKEVQASVVVIGVRKRRPAGKLLFGSVAQHVILHAEQPVICIK